MPRTGSGSSTGSAEQLLKGGAIKPGTLLGEVAPKLLYLLDTWRRKSYDWQSSTLSLLSAQGTALIQPHFVSLEAENRGPTLIFLEDTTLIAERVQQTQARGARTPERQYRA